MPDETQVADPDVISGVKGPDADGDAEMDAFFEANPLHDEDAPAEPDKASDGRSRDEHGRFKSTQETTETAEPDKSAEAVNPEDLQEAMRALKRAKTPQSVIDGMSEQALSEWGQELASVQKESDGFSHQLAELRKQIVPEPTAEAQAEPADADQAYQDIASYFGDEAVGPLKALLDPLLKAATPQPNGEVEKLAAQLREQVQRDARRELQEKHPEFGLDDDGRWSQLIDSRKADKNEYATEREALDAHRRLLFADEVNADARKLQAETRKRRDDGQPTPPSGGSPPGELSPAKLEDAYLDAQFSGDAKKMAHIKALMDAHGRKSGGMTEELMNARIGVTAK